MKTILYAYHASSSLLKAKVRDISRTWTAGHFGCRTMAIKHIRVIFMIYLAFGNTKELISPTFIVFRYFKSSNVCPGIKNDEKTHLALSPFIGNDSTDLRENFMVASQHLKLHGFLLVCQNYVYKQNRSPKTAKNHDFWKIQFDAPPS